VADVLFFGLLRDITGCKSVELPGRTIDELVEEARRRYGTQFDAARVPSCRFWVNGEPSTRESDVD
jgi:molybdopterin converting factor small subunit